MVRREASSLLCIQDGFNFAAGPELVASFLDQIGRNSASHIGNGYQVHLRQHPRVIKGKAMTCGYLRSPWI